MVNYLLNYLNQIIYKKLLNHIIFFSQRITDLSNINNNNNNK